MSSSRKGHNLREYRFRLLSFTDCKMEGNSDVINAAVDFVMNRKEEILKMGYLVKSPAKSKDKANYAMFWKVRWCVLVKAIFADPLLNAEYSNYLLYYYEDEEHYKQASLPKGHLDLSQCIGIRSCYKSSAGFNHIFQIDCLDHKLVKFSASSCKSKFKWLDVIFKNVYRLQIPGVFRSKVISQARSTLGSKIVKDAADGQDGYQKPRSFSLKPSCSEKTRIDTKDFNRTICRHDSGFSSSTLSSLSSEDEPPQLPPRRRRNSQGSLPSLLEDSASICSTSTCDSAIVSHDFQNRRLNQSDLVAGSFSWRTQPVKRGGSLKERRTPKLIDEYYYCEKCVRRNSVEIKNPKWRSSQKKKSMISQRPIGFIETEDMIENDENDHGRIYEEIDCDWLEMVRNMIAAADSVQGKPEIVKECNDSLSASPSGSVFNEAETELAGEETKEEVNEQRNQIGCYVDHDIYMRMDLFSRSKAEYDDIKGEAKEDTESYQECIYETMINIANDELLKKDCHEGLEEGKLNIDKVDGMQTYKCTATNNAEIIEEAPKQEVMESLNHQIAATVCNEEDPLYDDELTTGPRKRIGASNRRCRSLELSGFTEQYDTAL